MAYSEDYRKGIMKLHEQGESLTSLHKKLGISRSTLTEWKQKCQNGESLKKKEITRTARKFHDGELKKLIEKDCDITYEKIASHFGGPVSGAFDACVRNKITIKKSKNI
jgi:transposase